MIAGSKGGDRLSKRILGQEIRRIVGYKSLINPFHSALNFQKGLAIPDWSGEELVDRLQPGLS